jgi:uncharacterized protein (DUF433 family)/transposase-like protein
MKASANAPTLSHQDPRRRYGVFNVQEAAKYLGVRPSTMRNWAHGTGEAKPVITADREDGHLTVPFIGFAEAFVLTALRQAGVPMQRIRPAVRDLEREIGLEHALASRNLATDGAEVLYRYAGDEPDHTVVRSKQRQFRKAVEDRLRPVHYAADGLADRLWLPIYGEEEVFVDPTKAFGRPLLRSGRARVEDIADRFTAGESIRELARDFRVSVELVEHVIRVEAKACRARAS